MILPGLAVLIPAAGAARRMRGADKLLEEVEGQPALLRAVRLAGHVADRVLVTLPADGPMLAGRRAALGGAAATIVAVAGHHEGMAASLRAGVQAAGGAQALMVLLPDMPGLQPEDLSALVDAFASDPDTPLRAAASDGRPGHPVVFPRRMFSDLDGIVGDRGGQKVLDQQPVRLVPLAGTRAIDDLDTPEAWAAWRDTPER